MAEQSPPSKPTTRAASPTPASESIVGSPPEEYGVRDLVVEPPRPYEVLLQNPEVQRWLPISTSILLHALIVVIGVATYQAFTYYTDKTERQQIIPEAAFDDGMGEPGGIPHPGLGGDPTRDAAQDLYKDVSASSEGWASRPSVTLQETLAGGGSGEQAEGDSAIALGPNVGFGSGGGQGSGQGEGVGGGTGTGGGPLAPFGVPGGGGGLGPKANFMGMGGAGRNVIFLCDASGSMMGDPFDLLKQELTKAVNALRPVQGFNIMFFREGGFASPFDKLELARQENKDKAIAFLQALEIGSDSDARPAIKAAFRDKPNLVYILTDGRFEARPDPDSASQDITEEVRSLIKSLNGGNAVRVNTIAYLSSGSDEERAMYAEGALKTIAGENGGMFKVVTVNQLMKGSY